jgi:hypothetical protein
MDSLSHLDLEIKVSNEDFLQSPGYDSERCPLALALRRRFPNKHINVGGSYVEIGNSCYKIKEVWNNWGPILVTEKIKAAKDGEDVTTQVNLIYIPA